MDFNYNATGVDRPWTKNGRRALELIGRQLPYRERSSKRDLSERLNHYREKKKEKRKKKLKRNVKTRSWANSSYRTRLNGKILCPTEDIACQ